MIDHLSSAMRTLAFIVICIEFTITGFIHFTVCGARAQGFEVEGRHYHKSAGLLIMSLGGSGPSNCKIYP